MRAAPTPHIPGMDDLPSPHIVDLNAEIADLAQQYRRANGPVMSLVTKLGGSFEKQMSLIPATYRAQIDRMVASALTASFSVASQADRLPDIGERGRLAAAVVTGATGGAGGIATSIAELPVTISLILTAIRAEARAAGFDPDTPAIRAECIRTFGAGSPLATDDGVNTGFLSARLTLTGPAVQRLVSAVAPRLAAALGQKLAAQTVPVLGALSGAALNAAFLSYYRDIARIRFALLRLSAMHGSETVMVAFEKAVSLPRVKG